MWFPVHGREPAVAEEEINPGFSFSRDVTTTVRTAFGVNEDSTEPTLKGGSSFVTVQSYMFTKINLDFCLFERTTVWIDKRPL